MSAPPGRIKLLLCTLQTMLAAYVIDAFYPGKLVVWSAAAALIPAGFLLWLLTKQGHSPARASLGGGLLVVGALVAAVAMPSLQALIPTAALQGVLRMGMALAVLLLVPAAIGVALLEAGHRVARRGPEPVGPGS